MAGHLGFVFGIFCWSCCLYWFVAIFSSAVDVCDVICTIDETSDSNHVDQSAVNDNFSDISLSAASKLADIRSVHWLHIKILFRIQGVSIAVCDTT